MKEIKLTRGMVAMVDDEDFEWLNQWTWCAEIHGKTFYAKRTDQLKHSVFMHRVIMGLSKGDGKIIDHRDHNGLNNCRINLRLATSYQNVANRSSFGKRSKFLGVSFEDDRQKWRASIMRDGKSIRSPRFKKETDAAKWYNDMATELHGEFANLNSL